MSTLTVKRGEASDPVNHVVAELHLPDSIHAEFAGDARALAESAGAQSLLLFAALGVIYIVLGVLYESLAHPLTIISTLLRPASALFWR
jgi:multidrug efflux pump